jgi:hypothetical protein
MKSHCTQNTDRECREEDCCLKKTVVDNVNHPPHYTSWKAECSGCEKKIECIDVTRHLSFNIGNAIKYLWRYKDKNGSEDLAKAIWYINDEIRNYK